MFNYVWNKMNILYEKKKEKIKAREKGKEK